MAFILLNILHQNYGNKYLIIKKNVETIHQFKKQYKLFLLTEQFSE